jgi:ankyrin repeat protein
MVELLLSAGARHDIPGTTGLTPLHWAAGWGKLATVKVLVNAGADVGAKNEFGRTPAEVAREHGHVETAAFLDASPLTARSTATRKSSAPRQRGR